ncbi:MAG: Cof-type HAD-IIB family hydrolase [Peptococcaceae bacterium]|nr:Cof-type HAD-IIB family hydrolase [Peptococcaceae bacterium]
MSGSIDKREASFHLTCAAFDLDGTLLNAQSRLSDGNRAALEALEAAGIPVIIASGRPFSTIPAEILALDAVRYVVTGNGVRIYDKAQDATIYRCSLAPAQVDAILQTAQYYPVGKEFFISGDAFADRRFLDAPEQFGVHGAAFDYLLRTRKPVDDVGAFVRANAGEIDSMGLSIADGALKDQLWQRLAREVEDVYITSSLPRLIEIADARAGKAAAIAVVLERLGLEASGLAAFGDADNDLGMIEAAGWGVAMANGAAHLKEKARHIAPDHDVDGVAQVIWRLLEGGHT